MRSQVGSASESAALGSETRNEGSGPPPSAHRGSRSMFGRGLILTVRRKRSSVRACRRLRRLTTLRFFQ
ncbi:hypothetical protein C9J85_15895 [Haloferax sp. wsp5]|nr:hypothetical protein C9J85_15895 [Haloferax sp. wsp5]